MAQSRPGFKHQLFDQFARIGRALSSGPRLEILEYLAQAERSVETLATLTDLSVANCSRHLQLLRMEGLVAGRRDGKNVIYSLADPAVAELLSVLEKLAGNRLAEVEQLVIRYLDSKDDLEPLPREELMDRARAGLVTVLDVRPPEEYAAGHLPGAVNLPLDRLEQHLSQLPRGQQIVAYCRGPYCVLAYEAVARLRARGFRARRLEDGYPEWRGQGLPVEGRT